MRRRKPGVLSGSHYQQWMDKGAGFCLQETMFPMAGPTEIVKQRQTLLRTAAAAALSFSIFLSSQSIDPLAQL